MDAIAVNTLAEAASTEQTPARMVAGALAHLARHMETGCQRSAWLAAMLLERVANDGDADDHLRRHARELVEILEREGDHLPQRTDAPAERPIEATHAGGIFGGAF
jgi:hypothetical protein